ncbi:hypothetical protein CLROS_037580 [Clostridium felsineum]|uniref:Uncharacterized protein n=2 Tax=Clostridium felsineum TaxID=36839 RepID=A0A1S8LQ32_9CLOT|nr:hypothetical protein CLROS_037580 [Clostridium felsineum]URZ13407.1 hypothetical protein CROST_041730 [Clostridium felsineum]
MSNCCKFLRLFKELKSVIFVFTNVKYVKLGNLVIG